MIQPGWFFDGVPYSLKMPPAPQSGQARVLQSVICAGLKSMVLPEMLTLAVRQRQPSHQSSAGAPVVSPLNVLVSTAAVGRWALQFATVNGPLLPPSTRVHGPS